jgi:hypothetical protein
MNIITFGKYLYMNKPILNYHIETSALDGLDSKNIPF